MSATANIAITRTDHRAVVPKIANVKLMAEPSDTAKTVATLGRADELVVIGAPKDGFVNVQGAGGSGSGVGGGFVEIGDHDRPAAHSAQCGCGLRVFVGLRRFLSHHRAARPDISVERSRFH